MPNGAASQMLSEHWYICAFSTHFTARDRKHIINTLHASAAAAAGVGSYLWLHEVVASPGCPTLWLASCLMHSTQQQLTLGQQLPVSVHLAHRDIKHPMSVSQTWCVFAIPQHVRKSQIKLAH